MLNLKIIGGRLKNRNIKVPESARPVTTRVKTTIFDIISEIVEGARVLDLFAGSGNLGIEALSRGAEFAVFVDHNKESTRLIKENLKSLNLEEEGEVILADYKGYLKKSGDVFDIIFLDPPFNLIHDLNLKFLLGHISENGIIVLKVEDNSKIKVPESLEVVRHKKIGINEVYFIRKFN